MKGSIVIKRIHLLNMRSNIQLMWRNQNLDDNSRWNLFGKMCNLDRIIEGDISDHNWNNFKQEIWGYNAIINPSDTFKWLFDPTPLPREEIIHLYTLLQWGVDNEERLQEALGELLEEDLQ